MFVRWHSRIGSSEAQRIHEHHQTLLTQSRVLTAWHDVVQRTKKHRQATKESKSTTSIAFSYTGADFVVLCSFYCTVRFISYRITSFYHRSLVRSTLQQWFQTALYQQQLRRDAWATWKGMFQKAVILKSARQMLQKQRLHYLYQYWQERTVQAHQEHQAERHASQYHSLNIKFQVWVQWIRQQELNKKVKQFQSVVEKVTVRASLRDVFLKW